ncbi:MAG: DNA polymerase II large subunit [Thaumarchaeota archaeon]|nr:DNA polymerase II large subunit [Nitrososphaerota archaeon]
MNHLSLPEAYLSIIDKYHKFYDGQKFYNLQILRTLEAIHTLADMCKNQGKDPTLKPESTFTLDTAHRIDRMLNTPIAERLRELLNKYQSEQTAVIIADEIATGKFGFLEPIQALNLGVRVSLAIATEGLNIAPLQGISTVKIKLNEDNSKYASISFSPLIRLVENTSAAFSLIIADRIRKTVGLEKYRPNAWNDDEIGRMIEELRIYEKNFTDLEFHVSDSDIQKTIEHIPVEIDGIDTSPLEVIVNRAMKRIETNHIRGGALRVLNDGIIGRAKKLDKLLDRLGITDWNWLLDLEGGKLNTTTEYNTNLSFGDIISGRPILSKTNQIGGFRLRYGRAPNTGISTVGINPITAELLDYPVTVGTQIKISAPRKNTTVGFVDSIDGPIIRLKNGSVMAVTNTEELTINKDNIEKVLFLGDILISLSDFTERNLEIPPSGYTEEIWAEELRIKTESVNLNSLPISTKRIIELQNNPFQIIPTLDEAIILARSLNIGLHPKYTFYWDLVTPSEVLILRKKLKFHDEILTASQDSEDFKDLKSLIEKIGIPHTINSNTIIINAETTKIIKLVLALNNKVQIPAEWTNTCDFISKLSSLQIRNKTSVFTGVRVGKYEKATPKKTKPQINIIFPSGNTNGTSRDITLKTEYITTELANLFCSKCNYETYTAKCPKCNSDTIIRPYCMNCKKLILAEICPTCKSSGYPYSEKTFPLKQKLTEAIHKVHFRPNIPLKGVTNLINSTRLPEPLEKGILRLKHGLFVYKDGTTRFDVTNAPLTHCTPEMINVDIETLHRLGYECDIYENPLSNEKQTFELLTQDVVIPEEAADFLFKTANFIDDLLVHIYDQKAFYKLKTKNDIIGHLILGLAPQTSAGVIGRIIGITKSYVIFAHPFWHLSKRRDCSGDSDSIILLLDALLNFSKDYLQPQIGALIDTPLLIQCVVIPTEKQKQIHIFDTLAKYSGEIYNSKKSKTDTSQMTFKNKINQEGYSFSYTHPTSNISFGPSSNNYASKNTLIDKLENQIQLAKKITAVDPKDVVTTILQTHLLPDIAGNIKAYTTQTFQCNSCGFQYRRLPIRGDCLECGEKLQATVTKGKVEKYFKLAIKLSNQFDIDQQTKTRLEIITNELRTLFKTESTQSDLISFLQ